MKMVHGSVKITLSNLAVPRFVEVLEPFDDITSTVKFSKVVGKFVKIGHRKVTSRMIAVVVTFAGRLFVR